jgi:hypothetical protein
MQLPDLEVVALGPLQKQVASRLHQPEAVHHPLAMVRINTLTRIGLQDGGSGLVDLEEQRIVDVGHHEHDCAKRAHASHTEDLNGQAFPLESVQQNAALVGQRLPVTQKREVETLAGSMQMRFILAMIG